MTEPDGSQRGPDSSAPKWLTTCRAFIDSVGDQILVVGSDYQIMMVNSAFLESTGLPEGEIIGRPCHEITHRSPEPCGLAGGGCPLAAVQATGRAVSVAHVHFDASGEKRHVDVVGSPVRDADGHLVGTIESIRDVTRQKQLEEALLQRNAELEDARRKRDQFTSTVCHELMNILNLLSMRAQLLRSEHPRDTRAHAERIVDGSKRLARLVEDMRDAAAIESERFTLARVPCDLVLLARQAAAERQVAAQDHRIVVEAPEPALEGSWDAGRLRQVFDNLISNAIKFSPPGSEIRILVHREAQKASVSVRDAGEGIPAAKLTQLFQPYVRAHAHIQGIGLGLFVSRGIVEAHGGRIRVESTEGQGSTFSFWLPAEALP